ncbi:MAG TPA: 50S ribosomal protein L11 methyltransferase [Nitrospira sp.]|nr:50S ribosomal protein L11 methyltransferase [Nitrospira sp.]
MSSMSSDWVDIQIKSRIDAGELLAALEDSDVQGAWQDEASIHLYWPNHSWSLDRLIRIRQALQRFESMVPVPEIQVQTLPNQDWNRQWAESVKPLWVGTRIVIRPSWEPVDISDGQIEIVLDPKQAFGTGHHATTMMLLEWLEQLVQGGESVLDVGTGSGLLAMAALRLGATRAVGFDTDPIAIECAQEYATVNRFGSELSLKCGSVTSQSRFDLVLANLDRQTLLELAGPLAGCTGQRLLVSGLLLEQRQEILDAFARVDLYPARERERDGWLALEFTLAQSCEGA